MKSTSQLGAYVEPTSPKLTRFEDADQAVNYLETLYDNAIEFLRKKFADSLRDGVGGCRYRAYYPEIQIDVQSHATSDSRRSFGHVYGLGTFSATVTRPTLFSNYLKQQIGILIKNYDAPVTIKSSTTPIPIHFAVRSAAEIEVNPNSLEVPLRDVFDVPDLKSINDDIINGKEIITEDGAKPLAPFTAQRVDFSLARLRHYTATSPRHFQNFVLFTNYQFYVDGFCEYAHKVMHDQSSGYTELVCPGDECISDPSAKIPSPANMPQMPAYHLKRADDNGITLVNIGVGPSNAKTATDHIAVLRPRAWLMVGHCAGLRNTQSLGDYVLAHAYLRDDQVLDDDLPIWVPIPALAEIQIALEQAVAEVTKFKGYELKRIMRTGTVASVDNRNWELRANAGPLRRLSLSRAIAMDMESSTIAANGYRFRVPYGTLLCVSDKPLQGELKLPGMATRFYRDQVSKHLSIGIHAMESLRQMPLEVLQSRKLRSFGETAFL